MAAPADAALMALALDEARAAAAGGDVPVGCVIVQDDRILARAGNRVMRDGDVTQHAELIALREAARAAGDRFLPEATLVVTLEPCAMCAGAISNARINRLVYGASDPKGGGVAHGARVFDQPTCHWKPAVTAGVEAEAGAKLLKDFFKARR